MSKRFTKIICCAVAAVAAAGTALTAAGCSNYYKSDKLDGDLSGAVSSNGGFVVEKGDYVYFINGVESNTADNAYGTPVKGAIYRISKGDLSKRNYSSVQAVVPNVAYTADYNAGIFVYGDYIYYATPSTARVQGGEVQNSNLDLKRAKLDGTEAMKDSFVEFPSLSYEYRFTEVDGVVYLMYVAVDETLTEEQLGVTTSQTVKNLHSFNTSTGKDTLLAYNVDTVLFDGEDKTNPTVYYTMNVENYSAGGNYPYNQVYTVRADKTEANKYDADSEHILGWNDDEEKGDKDVYVNCGDLVFDGISTRDEITPFNYAYGKEGDAAKCNLYRFTYTLTKYTNGTLFYTRKTANNSNEYLFSIKDGALSADNLTPVTRNPDSDKRILADGSAAGDMKFVFDKDGELAKVIKAETDGGITVNKVVDGKLQTEIRQAEDSDYFYLVKEGTATLLFTDSGKTSDGREYGYLYYSISGGNGYSVNRVSYEGECLDYVGMPGYDGDNGTDDYTPVNILDVDACSDWYLPEIVENQLLFASETDSDFFTSNYVMACDLRSYDAENKTFGNLMTNKEIDELNDRFDGIQEIFDEYADTDKYDEKTYANLTNALKYAYYTGESSEVYLKDLQAACNDNAKKLAEEEGTEETEVTEVYSDATIAEYDKFIDPTKVVEGGNPWSDYTATVKVNGNDVYANRRDYYYGYMGKMSEADAEAYGDAVKSTYLQAYPEGEKTWWENINTAARVGFIIGMCACGLLIIGGAALAIVLVKRRKKKAPAYRKKIKVDTTDDKNIDVYADSDEEKKD